MEHRSENSVSVFTYIDGSYVNFIRLSAVDDIADFKIVFIQPNHFMNIISKVTVRYKRVIVKGIDKLYVLNFVISCNLSITVFDFVSIFRKQEDYEIAEVVIFSGIIVEMKHEH